MLFLIVLNGLSATKPAAQSLVFGQKKNKSLLIESVGKDVYKYVTFNTFGKTLFPSNGLYIVSNAGVILIDTPWDSTQFEALLDSIKYKHNKEVVLSISTHFHDDRTAGLDYYASQGIRTYSSKMTFDSCVSRGEKKARYSFESDTTFVLGQYTIETFYPGPGHTEDNIVIWIPHAKILYGGCFVKSSDSKDLGNISDANVDQWAQSIKNVRQRFQQIKYVIPGHFDTIEKQALQHTKKLVKKHLMESK